MDKLIKIRDLMLKYTGVTDRTMIESKYKKSFKHCQPEALLQHHVCYYLRSHGIEYIVSHSGERRNIIAQFLFELSGGQKAIPDLFCPQSSYDGKFKGLFIELKDEYPYKKDGKMKVKHIRSGQKEKLETYEKLGYKAVFAYPENVIEIINEFYGL